MKSFCVEAGAWLRRRAENVLATLLGVMFVAFLLQIVFRYFFNFPVGWTSELTVAAWLWLVLWGSAFVLRENEEIRFDLLYSAVGRRTRRVMGILAGVFLVALYALSFPATWSYVTFMKVERSSYLHVRLDWMYSIYVVFLVAVIVRYVWILWRLVRGKEPEASGSDSTGVSSGL
ncbi:MAG TPA: TRAP transporter small permease [Burkholderiales bacterium]|nr:TRAP transporter small permease [Burkholderiales bacterium]